MDFLFGGKVMNTTDKEDALHRLVERGKKRGRLTNQEILASLAGDYPGPEQLKRLYDLLEANGIEIVEDSAEGVSVDSSLERLTSEEEEMSLETDRKDNQVNMYVRDVSYSKALTPGKEKDILLVIDEEDESEKKRQEKAELRLVVTIAEQSEYSGIQRLDLIQEGNIALMTAVENFNPGKDFKYSTYTEWRIQQARSKAAEQGIIVMMPPSMRGNIRQINKAKELLTRKNAREPSTAEIAGYLGISEKKVIASLLAYEKLVSLNLSLDKDDNDGGSPGSADEDTLQPNRVWNINRSMMKGRILEVVDLLPRLEAEVIRLLFGLRDGQCLSLEEVGRRLHLSVASVRQIRDKAVRMLKHLRRNRRLREYI